MRAALQNAISAAAALRGRRFSLLVASSLVATTAILASALTGTGGSGALAALLARGLRSGPVPAAQTTGSPTAEPAASGDSTAPQGERAAPAPAHAPAPAAPAPEATPSQPPKPEAPPTPEPESGPAKHVFLVSLASPGYEAAFGAASEMPYLAGQLRPQGELLSGYSLLSSAGLANSIAAVSGQPPNPATEANCATYSEFAAPKTAADGTVSGSGCLFPVETLTLADQLSSARLTWRGYVEGMVDASGQPQSCVHPEPGAADQPAPGAYAARQNPFVYFHSLLDLGECGSNDVPLTQLAKDLRAPKSTPSFAYIAPSLCDAGAAEACPSGVASGPAAADAFLARVVPEILASPAYKRDGLLVVAFDEATSGAQGDPAAGAAQTGALLVSPFAAPGATDAAPYTPYSLLRSAEDLFGLPHLAKAGAATVRSFAGSLSSATNGD